MNHSSELRSSSEDRPSANPYSAGVPGTAVRETVLNPEGRPASSSAGSTSSSPSDPVSTEPIDSQDASLWRRLFPAEGDSIAIDDVEAAAGCELGHFSIEERIGSGGMGAVFRALDTRLQRVVALKVLAPLQSRDRAAVQRFQNEARAAARLDHENIARVFYIGEDRGLHFIAFEYITGQNVREIIARSGRLRVADAVNNVLQIAAALRHTAAAGVVHRDIKPSNIIITPSGRAKLVDLGLARKLAADSSGDLTVAGTTLGTFDYISPEQARDPRNVDIRSDIYSLGCTLYHMLTGGPPYSSGTMLQKLLDHQTGQAPDPRTANPMVPPALATICRKMMAGDPKNRFATPDELIRELAIVATGIGLRPMMTDAYIWTRPHASPVSRFRPGFIWMGSAGIVLLLAFFVDRWPSERAAHNEAIRPVENAVAGDGEAASLPTDLTPTATTEIEGPAGPSKSLPPDAVIDDTAVAVKPEPPAETIPSSPEIPGAEVTPEAPIVGDPAPAAPAEVALDPEPSNPPMGPTPETARVESSTVRAEEQASSDSANTEAFVRTIVSSLITLMDAGESSASAPEVVAERSAESSQNELSSPEVIEPTDPAILPFAIQTPEGTMSKLREFETLSAAISQAGDGEIIEIRVNGELPGGPITEPIRIAGREILLRAGVDANNEPYKPVVLFESNPADMGPARMIILEGDSAKLDIEGIEFRMTVGDASPISEAGALFVLDGASEISLIDVAITIDSDRRSCSVFDVRPASDPSAESPSFMYPTLDQDVFRIDIRDSFIRGTADLVTIGHTEPGKISIKNTGIAIQQSLLNVRGGIELAGSLDAVDVTLEHVTAVLDNPLLRIDLSVDRRYVAPIHITARDNVIATSEKGQLIFMNGELEGLSFADALTWTGERNIFDGFAEFWSVRRPSGGGAMEFPSSFSDWREYWPRRNKDQLEELDPEKVTSSNGDLVQLWSNPEAKSLEPLEFTPDDFELNPEAPLISMEATDAGLLVGVDPDDLPQRIPSPEPIAGDPEAALR